jgi:hypothetical protein
MKKGETKKSCIAKHEASHAVIARLHGCEIEKIDMDGDQESGALAFVICESLGDRAKDRGADRDEVCRGFEIDAIISLAGLAANRVNWMHNDLSDLGDYRRAKEKVVIGVTPFQIDWEDPRVESLSVEQMNNLLSEQTVKTLERLEAQALTEVKESWPIIERVAELLLSGKSIFSQEEIDAVINDKGGG